MRWEDVHPGEPDPGAPGPLPTVNLNYFFAPPAGFPAPNPVPPSPSPMIGDRPATHPVPPSPSPVIGDRPAAHPATPSLSPVEACPEPVANRQPAEAADTVGDPDSLPGEPTPCEPEWIYDPAPKPQPDSDLVLVAAADPAFCPPSATIDVTNAHQSNQTLPILIPHIFEIFFSRARSAAHKPKQRRTSNCPGYKRGSANAARKQTGAAEPGIAAGL
jgi:hypothetical protein